MRSLYFVTFCNRAIILLMTRCLPLVIQFTKSTASPPPLFSVFNSLEISAVDSHVWSLVLLSASQGQRLCLKYLELNLRFSIIFLYKFSQSFPQNCFATDFQKTDAFLKLEVLLGYASVKVTLCPLCFSTGAGVCWFFRHCELLSCALWG